jgi:hypothetical protein
MSQQQGSNAGSDAGNASGSVPADGSIQPQNIGDSQDTVDSQFTGENQNTVNQDITSRQQYGQAPQQNMGQRPEYGQRQEYGQKPYYPRNQQPPVYYNNGKPPLSNGLKVFLTMLFTLLPGIGQLAGIITAIVFMSADGDNDRRSFGVALLVASLAMFVLSCLGCFGLSLFAQNISDFTY